MRQFVIGVAAVATMALSAPVWAQVPPPPAPQPWPPVFYSAQFYPYPSVTPEDAYRDGLINRWQLEQYEGPLPQALQGPTPNGNKGMQTGR